MPYQAYASRYVGPAAIKRFDPTAYLERLQGSRAHSTAATQIVQQRAAQRKVEAEIAANAQREEAAAAAQAQIQARIVASQNKTKGYQQDTATKYQQISAQTARLQRQNAKQAAKLGAANNYENPNFRGGDGRLVAVGGDASKKAVGIINEALKYRGRMYQWGGASPKTSFDCSGLIQWAYKSMGVAIPRVSADQARFGRKIPLQGLRPGDLVAWDNSTRNSGADHVAIYIGNGQIIESSRTGQPIAVRALGNEQNAWGVQILR